MDLVKLIIPEIIVLATACVLFLLGIGGGRNPSLRKAAPYVAIAGLLLALVVQVLRFGDADGSVAGDAYHSVRVGYFTEFLRGLVALVGCLLVLLSWPTNRTGTGNSALLFDFDGPEYFSLMLCSIAGVMLVAGANDLLLLFMGIELAAIPTYILVSVSRPLPAAQEAGVKYFFLGAMAAAVLLFGFSYLYGTTGSSDLRVIAGKLTAAEPGGPTTLTAWQTLAFVMLIVGLAFKLAAVPFQAYAGDVYEGAATPVTAMLSFVPKASGVIALVKVVAAAGGSVGGAPAQITQLLFWLAALTMTIGNVLGLLQFNLKRLLAYSSIAHSGYLLVGLCVFSYASPGTSLHQERALQGVVFYLAAYGIMNVGVFAVLMMLPSRATITGTSGRPATPPATSAETFEDIAGIGKTNPVLALAMAVACFSLIGLPLTVGFLGKFYLIRPAWTAGGPLSAWMAALVVVTVINAAISAGYYLKIIATMFLRPAPAAVPDAPALAAEKPMPFVLALGISIAATLLFGAVPPAINSLSTQANHAALSLIGDRAVAPSQTAPEVSLAK
jgi:NADH-quinone oxidoreductase subunit N